MYICIHIHTYIYCGDSRARRRNADQTDGDTHGVLHLQLAAALRALCMCTRRVKHTAAIGCVVVVLPLPQYIKHTHHSQISR